MSGKRLTLIPGSKGRKNMKRVFLIFISAMFAAAATGCASIKSYRALDKDEMDMKPVCEIRLKRFAPTVDSAAMEYKGRTVYFCCASCVDSFNKYVSRHEKEENYHDSPGAGRGGGGGGHQH